MRILTVGNMYPPHHLGGYELVWQSAVRHLRGERHDVRVLTSDHREQMPGAAEDVDVHRELRWYWRDHRFPRLSLRERLTLERHNAAVFERHLAEHDPQLVSWWAMGGMSLSLIERARRRGLPSNAVVCDDWLLYAPEVDAWTRAFARRPWLRGPVRMATGIPTSVDLEAVGPALFPSARTRDRALEAVALADADVCPQGVDATLFPPAAQKPWTWRLLYVGRIDPRKGIALAIAALAELPAQATLTIAGAGDDAHLAELRDAASARGLTDRIVFTVRSREELAALYAESDAVLFPVVWEEPWGLVPLEAMAVGRCVVASGRGGSGEYLRDGENCLLADPDEGPNRLAAAIEELAGDERLRRRLREGGFQTAAAISEEHWNRTVASLCERAARPDEPIKSTPGAPPET
jgi:glycosyltransferase involved in cell wall biosynthesis